VTKLEWTAVTAELPSLAPELLLPAQEAFLALQQRAAEESRHLRSLVDTMPGFPPYADVPTEPMQLLLYYHRVTQNTETGGVWIHNSRIPVEHCAGAHDKTRLGFATSRVQ
jgi:hypothetical protein